MFCLGLRFVSYLGLKTCLLIWSTEISGGAFIRNSLTRLLLDHFYGIFSSHPTPLSQHLLRYGGFSLRSKRFRLVSKERKTEEGDFRFWLREKWNESHKIKEGEGEGKEGNACRQTPRFWKPAFASERSAWLARLVEQYWHVSIKGLFHTGREDLPSNARAFSSTLFETQSSSCDYIRVSGRLIYSPKYLLDLNN